MTAVDVVIPEGIDEPMRPSGGNVYDRRVCDGLTALGWSVRELPVRGHWPRADACARAGLAAVLRSVPDGRCVLVDGLVASGSLHVILPEADRLRLVVLLHMPLGVGSAEARAAERAVLSTVALVVTTSQWTRQWLLDNYALPPDRVRVAQPGAEPAELAPGTPSGGELLCVGAVTPAKGHDALVVALGAVRDLPWRCVCVGALDVDAGFVEQLRSRTVRSGIADRVLFTGALTGADLRHAYDTADLLVSASLAETYGMVVTEALARGLPVLATRVGGVPEALGWTHDGRRPGLLVPTGDSQELAAALRRWLEDSAQREGLREAAQARRLTLTDWSDTSLRLSRVLQETGGHSPGP